MVERPKPVRRLTAGRRRCISTSTWAGIDASDRSVGMRVLQGEAVSQCRRYRLLSIDDFHLKTIVLDLGGSSKASGQFGAGVDRLAAVDHWQCSCRIEAPTCHQSEPTIPHHCHALPVFECEQRVDPSPPPGHCGLAGAHIGRVWRAFGAVGRVGASTFGSGGVLRFCVLRLGDGAGLDRDGVVSQACRTAPKR